MPMESMNGEVNYTEANCGYTLRLLNHVFIVMYSIVKRTREGAY